MARTCDPHVLVVSTKIDVATDVVVRHLNAQGVKLTRINSEDFPFDAALTTAVSSESPLALLFNPTGVPSVSLQDVSRIWFRRIRSPEPPPFMESAVYDFCERESNAAIVGATLALTSGIMSPPANIWAAEHKLFQLAIARSVGLDIPDTVVTNDPAVVRDTFLRFNRKMIIKPIRSGFVDFVTTQHAIFTSQVLEEHLEDIDSARWSPAIYQPLIEKRCDLRVTVVGSKLFAASIDSQTDPAAAIDWRHTDNPLLPHYRADLPLPVCKAIRLLLRRLGLVFAGVDLILTPDNRYIFLEVNPNGQWLWLDELLDFGVSAAVAAWLSEPRR